MAVGPYPLNGWSFPVGGGRSAPGIGVFELINPFHFGADNQPGLRNASMYDFYLIALGPYIVEGEGPAMLQDVFLSPSDIQTKRKWTQWKELIRNDGGKLRHADNVQMRNVARVGSYRYAPSSMLSSSLLTTEPARGKPKKALKDALSGNAVGSRIPEQYIMFNSAANVSHPDRKVAFYLSSAVHDRRAKFWFQPGATSTVALFDGSARSVKPSVDGAVSDPHELSGPVMWFNLSSIVTPGGEGFGAGGEEDIEDIPAVITPLDDGWAAWFYLTWGGIRGRDF